MNYAPGIEDRSADYIMRGQESANRSTMQGAQALAAGIAGGTSKIGEAIAKVQQNKQEADALTPLGDYYFQNDPEQHAKFVSAGLSAKKGMIGAAVAAEARTKRDFDYWQNTDESERAWTGLLNTDARTREQQKLRGTVQISQPQALGGGTLITNPGTGAFDVVGMPKTTEAKPPTEAEVAFRSNVEVAKRKLDELEEIVKKHGNFENALGNPDARAKLQALPYDIAVLNAKIVDPTSVAREGEVSAAQKYLLPLGFWTPNAVTLAAIKERRATFDKYASERAAAQEAPAVAPSKASVTQPASVAPQFPRVSSKADFDALPSGAQYLGTDGRMYRKP